MSAVLVEQIKTKAKEIGFDLVGIASAEPSKYQSYLRQWLDAGQYGSMRWLANRFDERTNLSTYFPGVRSIISVACNYKATWRNQNQRNRGGSPGMPWAMTITQ